MDERAIGSELGKAILVTLPILCNWFVASLSITFGARIMSIVRRIATFGFSTMIIFSALFLAGCVSQNSGKPDAKERWFLVSVEGVVDSIDRDQRKVTLKDEAGNQVELAVSDQVQRFDEIDLGDTVLLEYWTFLKAEFRAPTEDEKENPIAVLAAAGKAPEDVDPAAAVGAIVRAVVTVAAINRDGREAAIQGPKGGIVVLPVRDDAVLDNLKVGEIVIMTYAEAVAVSLVKKP